MLNTTRPADHQLSVVNHKFPDEDGVLSCATELIAPGVATGMPSSLAHSHAGMVKSTLPKDLRFELFAVRSDTLNGDVAFL
jgi:hypothetical protein